MPRLHKNGAAFPAGGLVDALVGASDRLTELKTSPYLRAKAVYRGVAKRRRPVRHRARRGLPGLDVTTKRSYYEDPMEFEWQVDKAAQNLEKHGVSFEDALLVFYDSGRVEAYDGR
jgi:hypothetical protein